jgi:hypothetical protein
VERLHVLWDFERREICFHVASARAKLLDYGSLNARRLLLSSTKDCKHAAQSRTLISSFVYFHIAGLLDSILRG